MTRPMGSGRSDSTAKKKLTGAAVLAGKPTAKAKASAAADEAMRRKIDEPAKPPSEAPLRAAAPAADALKRMLGLDSLRRVRGQR